MEEQDIKEKILRGTEELFMKYGARSVSMDDIARHLAVSKKTLYQHFADKDDIVLMVCLVYLLRGKKRYEEIAESSVNAIDELTKISVCLKRDMENLNPSLLFDLQKYHPKAWEEWQQHKTRFIKESVARNLEQGIKEGYFRPEINTEIIATLRITNVETAFDDRIFPNDKFTLAEVQSQLFDHFVYGLCTEKGRKLYEKYKENNQPTQLINHKHETIL